MFPKILVVVVKFLRTLSININKLGLVTICVEGTIELLPGCVIKRVFRPKSTSGSLTVP